MRVNFATMAPIQNQTLFKPKCCSFIKCYIVSSLVPVVHGENETTLNFANVKISFFLNFELFYTLFLIIYNKIIYMVLKNRGLLSTKFLTIIFGFFPFHKSSFHYRVTFLSNPLVLTATWKRTKTFILPLFQFEEKFIITPLSIWTHSII